MPNDPDDLSPDLRARHEGEAQSSLDELLGQLRDGSLLGDSPAPAGAAGDSGAVPADRDSTPSTDDRREGDRAAAGAFSAVGDVVENVSEIPRQAVGGAADAVNGVLDGIDHIGIWLEERLPLGGFDPLTFDYTPPEDFNPRASGQFAIPAPDQPRTPTGQVVRGFSQFLTGFVPALRAFKGVGGAGAAATIGRATAAGAVSDFAAFRGQEDNLADFLSDMGVGSEVLETFLATDPDDGEAVSRFKNALSGAVGGAVLDGVLQAGGILRNVRRARQQARAQTGTAVAGLEPEVENLDFKVLGDREGELISTKPKEPSADEKLLAADADVQASTLRAENVHDWTLANRVPLDDASEIEINFARIDTPDDVKAVIDGMAQSFAGRIDEARRGVVGDDEVRRLADRMKMTPETLLQRRKGEAFNAEQALAARELMNASARTVMRAAEAVRAAPGSEKAAFVFRRAMAVHHAIQQEVLGARAEAGRALRAWSIPAGEGKVPAKLVLNTVFRSGGPDVAREMADRVVAMGRAGVGPEAMDEFANASVFARSMDVVRTAFINGMLSSPKTHVVNITSNFGMLGAAIVERRLGAEISRLRGADGDAVAPAEAGHMVYGLVEGFKDALHFGWLAAKTGEGGRAVGDTPRANASKIDNDPAGSVTRLVNAREGGTVARAAEIIDVGLALPTRMLGAEDEFFKSLNYRMQLRALAARTAFNEGLSGEAAKVRIAEVLDNPPDDIKAELIDFALVQTFTNENGSIGKAFQNLRQLGGPIHPGMYILPFLRTPVNLVRAFAERSPFAPLVKQWNDDIAAGGARKDMALARMSGGSMIMLTAMDYAFSGQITGEGPTDPRERETLMRTGWRPYSVKVGDTWYSYNRLDPLGATLGFAANVAETFKTRAVSPEDVDEINEILAVGISSVAASTMSKTYVQGVTELVAMLSDPRRYGPGYVNDFFGRFVPYGALLSNVNRAMDPELKDTNSVGEYLRSRVAIWDASLPPRRDLWGRPIRIDSGLGKAVDFFSPISISTVDPEPVDLELQRLGFMPGRLSKKTSFRIGSVGVDVDLRRWPEVYSEVTRRAGNGLALQSREGRGLMDFLNGVVTGDSRWSALYARLPDGRDGGKANFIADAVRRFRDAAKRDVLDDPEFADFRAFVEAKAFERRASRLSAPEIQ